MRDFSTNQSKWICTMKVKYMVPHRSQAFYVGQILTVGIAAECFFFFLIINYLYWKMVSSWEKFSFWKLSTLITSKSLFNNMFHLPTFINKINLITSHLQFLAYKWILYKLVLYTLKDIYHFYNFNILFILLNIQFITLIIFMRCFEVSRRLITSNFVICLDFNLPMIVIVIC